MQGFMKVIPPRRVFLMVLPPAALGVFTKCKRRSACHILEK